MKSILLFFCALTLLFALFVVVLAAEIGKAIHQQYTRLVYQGALAAYPVPSF